MLYADLDLTRDHGTPPPLDNAPMVWIAVACSIGIVLDHQLKVPCGFAVVGGMVSLVAWWFYRERAPGYALGMLLCSVAALAAGYHGIRDRGRVHTDISFLFDSNQRVVRLRGRVDAELSHHARSHEELELIGRPGVAQTKSVITLHEHYANGNWRTCTGRLRWVMDSRVEDLHIGDEVECTGRLIFPEPARNPGESDERDSYARRNLRGTLVLSDPSSQLMRLRRGWPESFSGWLGVLRSSANNRLSQLLGPDIQPLASALLLGDGTGLGTDAWQRYMRTGIVHVLAVSGQHLMVLSLFLQLVLRVIGAPPRRGLLVIAAILLLYALLAGGRPPVMRAAIMCCTYCLALLLTRSPSVTSAFATAWVVILIIDPMDILDPGCQLSFLSVAIITWVLGPWISDPQTVGPWWLFPPTDPLDRLIEAGLPWRTRAWRLLLRLIMRSYAATIVITVCILPIVAYRYHIFSLSSLLISPPLILFASIALVLGFLMLLLHPLGWILAFPVRWLLVMSESLISIADRVPGGCWYVADWPGWWVAGFYLLLALGIWLPNVLHRLRAVTFTGLAWCTLGLLLGAMHPGTDELRATFLAVGHGTCVVIEIPGGRTILYDAGSMVGPQVVRQKIAPLLWSRGITRIDEILISHGDLDHCNGLPALLECFAVGVVSFTPTFSDKQTPAIASVLRRLHRQRVTTRVLSEGQRLISGALTMDVLHPPLSPVPGNENARSMVLLLQHAGHRLLLTGDLEGAGLARVLQLPPCPVDVMMAPHHGSNTSNHNGLASWARPRVVISCQGPPRPSQHFAQIYAKVGAASYDTWNHGAVTVRSHSLGLHVDSFLPSHVRHENARGE